MIETRRFLSYLSMALCLFSLPLAPTHAGQAGGKQYIAVPIGGANQPAELVALSLP